jgi:hypothetical protein
MAIRLCANLVLLNRIYPFVAMLLEGGPTGVASSVEKHKRIWKLPVNWSMSEIGYDRSREACTRILNGIDQRGCLPLNQWSGSTKKQHRRYPKRYPGEMQIPEKLTHGASPFSSVGWIATAGIVDQPCALKGEGREQQESRYDVRNRLYVCLLFSRILRPAGTGLTRTGKADTLCELRLGSNL